MPVHIFFLGGGGENSEKRFKSCSQEQQSYMCTYYYKTLKMTVQENISANPCSDFPMK